MYFFLLKRPSHLLQALKCNYANLTRRIGGKRKWEKWPLRRPYFSKMIEKIQNCVKKRNYRMIIKSFEKTILARNIYSKWFPYLPLGMFNMWILLNNPEFEWFEFSLNNHSHIFPAGQFSCIWVYTILCSRHFGVYCDTYI